MTDESTATAAPANWHERSVERSLKAARERAIQKGDKFISAAADLLRDTGQPDFTVQEVVDRSGMSLRSFYQHFASKDDLLLALFEETIRRYIDGIRPAVEAAPDPVEKMRVLLRKMCRPGKPDDPASRGLVVFHWHLADTRTDEFAAILEPQVVLINEIVAEGVDAGQFRTDIPAGALASLVNSTVLSSLQMRALGVHLAEPPVETDHLVEYCISAIVS